MADGATGIGAATAFKLSQALASVVIGDINLEGAENVVGRINCSGGRAKAVKCDISDEQSVAARFLLIGDGAAGLACSRARRCRSRTHLVSSGEADL